ncbi:MAG: bifunctional diaminohydroxyphosphoribosylaminopyrimidine deaminase/5-amino-6-(5-phosphoribosylamino)uracil reductase RibD [Blastocatellia bacterium]|nr:bifunctional diaminohydroxyphosphoribosylaminopyrimidine deaminase/5-amino-6-(5-phosphoribosylamino)uracil reductase RibD [Blastocatellia bacterium]
MADKESEFMLKALELARRGAGLVSPNPMVGAVIVNEGRIVGEGYHLYDGLKHAETYAIEMAGREARGSTLYCSLEPCCHYGRTSPCTDALIEAGIARAVIAVVDSNPQVNGRGIAQLEAAGITVEVGMYEREALRLNECYFKYVTRGVPFVHGAVIYAGNDETAPDEWKPSQEFLRMVSEYDAVVLGCENEYILLSGPNRALIEACLSRKRHRPPVIAGTPGALEAINSFSQAIEETNASILAITDQPEGDPGEAGVLKDEGCVGAHLRVRPDENRSEVIDSSFILHPSSFTVRPGLAEILRSLARLHVTSCTILANSRDRDMLGDLAALDKLTLILPGTNEREAIISMCKWEDLVIGLDGVEYRHTGRYTEMIGYPRESESH